MPSPPSPKSTKKCIHFIQIYHHFPQFTCFSVKVGTTFSTIYLCLIEKFCPWNRVLSLLGLSVFKIQVYFLILSRISYKKGWWLQSWDWSSVLLAYFLEKNSLNYTSCHWSQYDLTYYFTTVFLPILLVVLPKLHPDRGLRVFNKYWAPLCL